MRRTRVAAKLRCARKPTTVADPHELHSCNSNARTDSAVDSADALFGELHRTVSVVLCCHAKSLGRTLAENGVDIAFGNIVYYISKPAVSTARLLHWRASQSRSASPRSVVTKHCQNEPGEKFSCRSYGLRTEISPFSREKNGNFSHIPR